jgi:hypothetical protein
MESNKAIIQAMLDRVFDDFQSHDDEERHELAKQQFVFHMTDWAEDLFALCKLYARPSDSDPDAGRTIARFLYHVIPHLNAAGRLLLDQVPDPFTDLYRKADTSAQKP